MPVAIDAAGKVRLVTTGQYLEVSIINIAFGILIDKNILCGSLVPSLVAIQSGH
jgi:hypothetical protein